MKVMVTGATEGFGLLLVKALSHVEKIDKIIGVKSSDIDYAEKIDDDKLYFETAKNLRPRVLEDVFKKNHNIDVVVHLAYNDTPTQNESEFLHETNVFGTMRLLNFCKKYGVKKFIHKSPSSIYGAHPDNPVLIKENYPLRGNRSYQLIRDKIEADILCQLYMKENDLPKIVILRFCSILGEHIRSPLNTIFKGIFVPMVLGYDPMFQIMDERDVVEAIKLCILDDSIEGVFNIAGKKIEHLSEVITRLGKIPMPIPEFLINIVYKPIFKLNQEHSFPFDINYWKYPFVIDTSKAKKIINFEPKYL
jgi:UDP-glucose 4-epimerase